MNVKIIAHTSDPLKTLFTAIRTCYSPYTPEHIQTTEFLKYLEKQAPGYPNDAVRLLSKVAKMGHMSTLEHVSFTFTIEGVSRALLAQLTRHRIGFSYSVQSQRYVDFESESKSGGMKSIEPHSVANNANAHKLFTQLIKDIQAAYDILRSLGISAEDARYILPNSASTNITLTCNLRSFLDFYNKRHNNHAQWEINSLAQHMREAIVAVFPEFVYLESE